METRSRGGEWHREVSTSYLALLYFVQSTEYGYRHLDICFVQHMHTTTPWRGKGSVQPSKRTKSPLPGPWTGASITCRAQSPVSSAMVLISPPPPACLLEGLDELSILLPPCVLPSTTQATFPKARLLLLPLDFGRPFFHPFITKLPLASFLYF